MTLILTDLSPLGICMVGDTALTTNLLMPDHTLHSRSFNGITKVIPVSKINAGLSYWGWAHLDPLNSIEGIPMDWWISNFLRDQFDYYDNLEELAQLLESELRVKIPSLSEDELNNEYEFGNGGIHLAGYEEIGNEDTGFFQVPSFWHIHNGKSQRLGNDEIDPSVVNANHDVTPEQSLNMVHNGQQYYTVNGENVTFNLFVRDLRNFIRDRFETESLFIPIPNLLARADFWKAIIIFISNLYQVSGSLIHAENYDIIFEYPVSVGDEVTILTITPRGITNYFTT